MPILRSVVAMRCEQPGCQRSGQRMASHERFCEGCQEPLAPVLGWNLGRIALAIGGPLVLASVSYALISFIANRPRPLSEERRQRLAAWVREADGDRVVAPREKAALDDLVKKERLDPQAVAGFVAEARQLLEESRRANESGHRLAAQGRYAEARLQFRRAVENDPGNAMAWVNLGLANAASGNEQEAFEGYDRALRLDPENWLAHYNLGLLKARRGDLDQALRHLENAFAARPDPASPERRSMVDDLRATAVPAALRRDPRFAALLSSPGEPAR